MDHACAAAQLVWARLAYLTPRTYQLDPTHLGGGAVLGGVTIGYVKLCAIIVCLFTVTTLLLGTERAVGAGNSPQLMTPLRATQRVPLVDGNDLQFRHLPVPLSQTRVVEIVQDHRGFLWFGTQDGLNRYDGYEVKVFRHDSHRDDSLSGVNIFSLFEDRSGGLWVGSDEFLDRFDPISEKFTRYEIKAELMASGGKRVDVAKRTIEVF